MNKNELDAIFAQEDEYFNKKHNIEKEKATVKKVEQIKTTSKNKGQYIEELIKVDAEDELRNTIIGLFNESKNTSNTPTIKNTFPKAEITRDIKILLVKYGFNPENSIETEIIAIFLKNLHSAFLTRRK